MHGVVFVTAAGEGEFNFEIGGDGDCCGGGIEGDWFDDKRGLALGIKFSLIGLLAMLILPVVTWLVAHYGWRVSCLLWGMILLCSSPLILFFVKQNKPECYGLLPDGKPSHLGTQDDFGLVTDELSLTTSELNGEE